MARSATPVAVKSSTDLDTLTDFFDRYGVALTAGDVPAIAGCYALPGLVVADWSPRTPSSRTWNRSPRC